MNVIGIDEAGRGPLAGPVTVGAFGADEKTGKWIIKNIFDGRLRDSKKLSEKQREDMYKKLKQLKNRGKVNFSFVHISNKVIDKKGITAAVIFGVRTSLVKLHHTPNYNGHHCMVRLDGLLKAPTEYTEQKTIIKGDERDVFIACASIVAKVERDRLMCKIAKKYPDYNFDTHKGYGTRAHRAAILKIGLSSHHRASYCKNIR
jgi:ribonuclease HII